MRSLRALALLSVVALPALAQARYAGRPLDEVLREIQSRGLSLVYSSDLVKPEAHVAAEPRARSDRGILDEILAAHALSAADGPGGIITIVAAPAAPAAMPLSLGSITVTASRYPILGGAPEHRQFLTREEVARTPHVADDIFRTFSRLPGMTSTEFSAGVSIRGGAPDEVLVLLDGMEIADPFHMKYFQNAISIVDSAAIGSVELLSGGPPAEYGGRMSGVIDMSTASAPRRRTYAGISFTHARLMSAGTFDEERGEWLLSARRGYFDLLLDLFYPSVDLRPRYSDVIAKVQHALGNRSIASAQLLLANDRFRYDRSSQVVDASYESYYGWVNVRTAWTPRLSSQTVVSLARLRQEKDGSFDEFGSAATVNDDRAFDIDAVRQDWIFDCSERRHYLKAGFDVRRYTTNYQYDGLATITEPLFEFAGNPAERRVNVAIAPRGETIAAYAADRIRLARSVMLELGLRWEKESWDRSAIAPRVNAVWTADAVTSVRASFGAYRQPQRLDAMLVEDGDATLYPAQLSRQSEVSVERRFGGRFDARLAAYRKSVAHVRPRYENLIDRYQFFPEAQYDRVRIAPDAATIRGVEVSLKDSQAGPVTWWIALSRSEAAERFGETRVPGSWDQPNAASFSVNYSRDPAWNFNVAGLFHSGWPTTEVKAVLTPSGEVRGQLGPRGAERHPPYVRIDLRALRSSKFRGGRFSVWLDIANVFNRYNAWEGSSLRFSVDRARGTASVERSVAPIGIMPSFGVGWEL